MKKVLFFIGGILMFVITNSFSSDLVGVKPVTNKILMLHFDDGYVIHHKRGEPRTNESVVVDPLDVINANIKSAYELISPDDSNYLAPQNPLEIARKTKPTEFALLCQTYDNGCINTDPDHAKEHWIYLFLPHELQSGKSYTLTLDIQTSDKNTFSFVFDEAQLHAETIHVNNIGYSTTAPAKYAYLYHWMGDKGGLDLSEFEGEQFSLYDVDNKKYVFTDSIQFRRSEKNVETGQNTDTPNGNFASADVYECDFSDFNTPGNYKVVVEGIGSSFEFKIGADVYREAFYWTMKGLYQNRSGIELKEPYTNFPRPAPHNPERTPEFSGKLKYSAFRTFDMSSGDGEEADKAPIEDGYKGTLEHTYGWYQDAGDWDGYYTHTHIPAYLLFLYEAAPAKFTDGELNIPESGNGIPDVLDEAAWLLRYFKRAKDEIVEKGWGTGGVPGARVFGDLWGEDAPDGVGQGSWQDTGRDWYLLGEDPWTSYKFAAMAAQLAFILNSEKLNDPGGVDWEKEAIDAFGWAQSNTRNGDEESKLGIELSHIRMYAAASLYRLTGEGKYHVIFRDDNRAFDGNIDMGKPDGMFGAWMYLLSGSQLRANMAMSKVKSAITQSTNKFLLNTAESRSCRWGGNFYFPMLIGQPTTPMITPAIYGYLQHQSDDQLSKNYLKYIHTTADYFLGCNPLNMTWISGVAERYPVGLFHLDWWYRDKEDPNNAFPVIEGVVPYGPWRVEDFGDLGWWNPNWAYRDVAGNPRIYPEDIHQWPGHERWFDMRVSPLVSEFTVHQNTVVSAFVYGFLCDGTYATIEEGEIITGLEKSRQESPFELKVYANPAYDIVNITVNSDDIINFKKVEIISLEGNTLRLVNKGIPVNEMAVDVSGLDQGIYIVKVTSENHEVYTSKLKIEK